MELEKYLEMLEKEGVRIPAHIRSKKGLLGYLKGYHAMLRVKYLKVQEELKVLNRKLEVIKEAIDYLEMEVVE